MATAARTAVAVRFNQGDLILLLVREHGLWRI
jgi:hypothetical protein